MKNHVRGKRFRFDERIKNEILRSEIMLYVELANRLLATIESEVTYFEVNPNHRFEYKKNYSGLMADIKPKYKNYARKKQGLFDIKGTMSKRSLTHNEIFQMLLENATIEQCYCIWRGIWPANENLTNENINALLALLMLMFEQEINFGNEIFQRKSHFSPLTNDPNSKRPRDLLMGYVVYVFEKGNIESLKPYEQFGTVRMPDQELKVKYFDILENDRYAFALMSRPDIVQRFRDIAADKENNPGV